MSTSGLRRILSLRKLQQARKWHANVSCVSAPCVHLKLLLTQPNFYGKGVSAQLSTSTVTPELQASHLMEVKFEELQNLLSSGSVVLVDVREPKELLEDGKIPGSINVPLGEVESAFALPSSQFDSKYGGSLPDREESSNLVVSCRSGKRAAMALEKIKKRGYEGARIYSGSFQDWVANGGAVEKP